MLAVVVDTLLPSVLGRFASWATAVGHPIGARRGARMQTTHRMCTACLRQRRVSRLPHSVVARMMILAAALQINRRTERISQKNYRPGIADLGIYRQVPSWG